MNSNELAKISMYATVMGRTVHRWRQDIKEGTSVGDAAYQDGYAQGVDFAVDQLVKAMNLPESVRHAFMAGINGE